MNYQQPQQQQQLPFDPNNCTNQPMQFNQAPFVPNNLPLPQQLVSFLPVVAAMVANEVSSNCRKNSGRTFLFNQLSSNNYVNQEFSEAVQTAMDMLILGMVKGLYGNPNQGMADAVNKALIMCNAANFQRFPALQQYVPPELYNDAVNIVNTMQSVRNDIVNAKNQINQQPQQQQPMMMQGGYPQNPQQSNFQQGGFQQGNFQPSRMQPGLAINSSPAIFSSQRPAQAPQQTNSQYPQAGRYDYLKGPNNPVQAPVAQQSMFSNPNMGNNQSAYFTKREEPVQMVEVVQVETQEKLVWKPTVAQWHPATCNTRLQKIVLKKIKWADDNTYVVTVATNLTEEEMEEQNHKIGFTEKALMSATPERYASRNQAIADNVDAFVERNREVRETPLTAEEDAPAFSVANSARYTVSSNFLAPAIFKGRVIMKKKLQQTENDLAAYGVNAIVSSPVLVDDTQEKLMGQLYECRSFLRIQAVLKNALTNKSTPSVSKELASKIDKLFTKEINSILNNRLSLDVKIDSFVEDAADLVVHLKNNLGELFSDAYLSCQEDFVDTYLNQVLIDSDMASAMASELELEITEEPENTGYVLGDSIPSTFITQFYTITFLQVMAKDLSISQFSIVGTEVIMSANPELYKLAKEMFDEEENKVIPIAHRLLITADNVIYEFHKGLINKDFVTISKYHG